ncbi:biotin carboxylase N-terminal domain-containing protein [Nevskia sp.]|uniref:acetyl/propionyl/methylcrotonyl-CoA carboxylase subunit alpha n=1 Tax=Nevskia sp. TaxID=1929292 RepID=UPI0025D44AC1|nr:biotin carboxylase N-terminal domain-containing protein [Nevskia sp.]
MKPIHKLLIANRGEIACRIARTARQLGIAVVGIHSQADARARHVRELGESVLVGTAAPAASYLNIPAIIAAAKKTGADAIHPGYGFVSENAEFVRAVEAAGLCFVGPTAETMERLGGKASAKREAAKLGIPTVPGDVTGLSDPAAVIEAVRAAGLPALLKAVAGGGGRGMALIENFENLPARVDSAMREAAQAFGSGDMIVERYLPQVRHIEVQIAGDGHGRAIHLYERECSLQRRHQKVIEEAPSAGLEAGLRARILDDACRLAAALNYRGLGTVEFIVSGDEYYFLEVNPRLQVEHPVTEEITGLDLVELQLHIAATGTLGLTQDQVTVTGHSFEARVYAEDAEAGFLPGAGKLHWLRFPAESLRVESGVDAGDEITPFYDPMIAKLVSRGATRVEALDRLCAGLASSDVVGLTTNLGFLRELLGWEETRSGRMHTRLIDERWRPSSRTPETPAEHLAAAALWWLVRERGRSDWGVWTQPGFSGWRTQDGPCLPSPQPSVMLAAGHVNWAVHFAAPDAQGYTHIALAADAQATVNLRARLSDAADGARLLECGDISLELRLFADGAAVEVHSTRGSSRFDATPPLAASAATAVVGSELKAPMMGKVVAVLAAEGDAVKAGQTVFVMESMKMELQVVAERDGALRGLRCAAGDMVGRGDVLCEVTT